MGLLAEIAEQIRSGRRSPVELLESCLQAIEQREDEVHAWAHLDREGARAHARLLETEVRQRGPRSPLHGIPVGLKDIYDTADMPTEWGAEPYVGRQPSGDSGMAAELRRLGAIILGKTHTTAFAYFDPAPTRNPWNPEHTPGGSSSGSAAAVAAGMAPLAIGSQTMGSVLRPASFCGVVGFKPTFGKLSLEGVLPFAPSFDHPGLFTFTADDMAFAWQALTGEAPEPESKPRLAAMDWPPEGRLEAPMAAAFESGVERLLAAGFTVDRVDPPKVFRALPDAILAVLAWEAAEVHRERLERYGERIGPKLAHLIRRGLETPSIIYDQSRHTIREAAEAYAGFVKEHPVCLTPAALGPAPAGLASTGDPRANAPWTALGVPAVAIRLARTGGQLPLGLQITVAKGRDAFALTTAVALERALEGRLEAAEGPRAL